MPTALVSTETLCVHYVNAAFGRLMEGAPEAVEGAPVSTLFIERDAVDGFLASVSLRDVHSRTVTMAAITGAPLKGTLTARPVTAEGDRAVLLIQFVEETTPVVPPATIDRAVSVDEMADANARLLVAGIREQEAADRARRDASDMKALITSMSDGVVVFEKTGDVSLVNAPGCDMFAFDRLPTLDDFRRCDLRSSDGRQLDFERDVLAVPLRGESLSNVELVLHRRDESPRHLMLSANAVLDSAGVVARALHVIRDVTQLRELEKFREQSLSLIAHDLRGPLSVIGMAANLETEAMPVPPDPKHPAARIVQNVRLMDRLIRDLLNSQRVRAGHGDAPRVERCDIVALAREVIDELTFVHGDRFNLGGAETCFGTWNSLDLRRTIWNLATNAIKYGGRDTPIELNVAKSANAVSLEVKNSGNPIPPQELASLFEPHYRGKSTDRVPQSWGLGLAFVDRCAKTHGGTISVVSSEAAGTIFTLRLPCAARSREPQ